MTSTAQKSAPGNAYKTVAKLKSQLEGDLLITTLCGTGLAGEGEADIFWFKCIWEENVCFGGKNTEGESGGKAHTLFGGKQNYATKCKIIALIGSFISLMGFNSPKSEGANWHRSVLGLP